MRIDRSEDYGKDYTGSADRKRREVIERWGRGEENNTGKLMSFRDNLVKVEFLREIENLPFLLKKYFLIDF